MKRRDLIGEKFGLLTVKEPAYSKDGRWYWHCSCDCGKETIRNGHDLTTGKIQSCGCLHTLASCKNRTKHGGRYTRLYRVWCHMKERCYNKHNQAYKNYGGRGIRICDEWKNSFPSFRDWALYSGYDEHAPHGQCTLDRIDNDGDYEPGNCRWATMKEQSRNRRKRKKKQDV